MIFWPMAELAAISPGMNAAPVAAMAVKTTERKIIVSVETQGKSVFSSSWKSRVGKKIMNPPKKSASLFFLRVVFLRIYDDELRRHTNDGVLFRIASYHPELECFIAEFSLFKNQNLSETFEPHETKKRHAKEYFCKCVFRFEFLSCTAIYKIHTQCYETHES